MFVTPKGRPYWISDWEFFEWKDEDEPKGGAIRRYNSKWNGKMYSVPAVMTRKEYEEGNPEMFAQLHDNAVNALDFLIDQDSGEYAFTIDQDREHYRDLLS